ncbi:MFS transporter [Aeromicrobium sp. 636]|uniref:MFS transporter n=2 Tax=Nocardioidaceae TaxID=85015 RepID=A0A8I0K1Z2_9ACTN|nr:MFS transporter [Aeromicrobium senzhongii]MBC9225504.1 MFS transporter [Aeromicrobium senzhongii]MCQ3997614.1 MFS transporter [Aeromicrobium sp. 636]
MVLLAVGLGISGAPAPLYGVYAAEWDFAPLTTTVVFAVYAFGALVSVVLTGPVSDRIGRRPVLIAAVLALLAGLALFVLAESVAWLIVARAIHGVGVGAIVVTASAALLDLQPDQGARSGKRTGVAFNLGIAISIMATALIAQYGAHPLVTPYVLLAVLITALLVAILVMREPHDGHGAEDLRIARPRVPGSIAADFRFAAIGVMASWSVLGVFLSLFPKIASDAVGTDNLVFGGSVVALSAFAAAISQLVAVRWTPRVAAVAGDAGTAVMLLVSIVAIHTGSAVAILATSTVLGFFFGMAFGSSLRHLGDVVPAGHRGEVMSAFYVLAYSAMAVPTILAGWAATTWSPEQILAPFLACVALASVVAGVLGWRLQAPDADAVID